MLTTRRGLGATGLNRVFVVLFAALVLLMWPRAAAAAPVVDQQQLVHGDMDINTSISSPTAQTFRPSMSGRLEMISLMHYRLCPTDCLNREVWIEIREGTPTGPVIATASNTITSDEMVETWYDYTLSPQPLVTQNTLYTIVVTGSPSNENTGLSYKWANVYSRGSVWVFADIQSWHEWTGADDSDIVFKTWMAPNTNPTVATNTGLTVLEGGAGTIAQANLRITDAESIATGLTFTVASAPANGTLRKSGTALTTNSTFTQDDIDNSRMTYTHNGSETSTDSFAFTVADGMGGSLATTTFNLSITGVNDAPVFTKGGNQTVNEDAGAQSVANWATAISTVEPGQTASFGVTNNNNALFSVQPAVSATGTLTYTPAANASGIATVTVTLTDNGGTANGGVATSSAQSFTITVIDMNDPPSFIKGANQAVAEDAGAQSVANWATAITAVEAGQTVSFNVTNNNNSLFSAQPSVDSNGTLTYTPQANAYGAATVTVTLTDNGGTANGGVATSAAQTFTISVTAVNDPPSFTKGGNLTLLGDAEAQTVPGWATAIAAGPANESAQTLTFTVTNDNNARFAVQPAIAADGTLTYTPASGAAGGATVTVILSDDGGTASGGVNVSAAQTFTFTQATTTSVTAVSGQYGGLVSLSASVTAGVAGDVQFSVGGSVVGTASVNTGTGVATLSYTITNSVGTYPVSAAFAPTSVTVAASSGTGTLTVSKAPLTVTAADATRGFGEVNPAFTASSTGFVLGQDLSVLSGTLTFTTPATASSNSGNYAITPAGLTSSNYAITFVDGTLTVTPAPLTVTANNTSKVYGDANPAFTVSYSGFVLGQTPSVLGGTLTFTTTASESSDVGNHPITPSGQTSSNYAITFVDGTLTVTPTPLTITVNETSKVYGEANPAFTVSYSGFVPGQTPAVLGGTLTFTTTADQNSGVGTYSVTPAGQTSTNYTITFVNGSLSVTPAPLTVTANDKSRTYGAVNPAFAVSYSGFVLGQTPSVLDGALTLTTGATQSSNAGTYAIASAGLTSANYTITFVDGTLTVTPAPLTVTANDTSKGYGDANPAFTVSYSGFVLGQTPSVLGGTMTFTTTADQNSGVGTYSVTPAGQTSTNYAITFVDGGLTVTPAPLTVKADNQSKVYGDANPAFTANYSGFVLGQGPSVLGGTLTFNTTATESSDVGNYPITPAGQTSANYAITFVDGNLSVTPAPLTVKADNASKVYGDPVPAFTASYSGFVLGQTPSVLGGTLTFTTAAGQSSNVDTYPVTASGLTSNNYEITFTGGTLTVTPAPLAVTANNASKVYGEPNPVFTASFSGFVLGQDPSVLGGTLAFTTAAGQSSDVGTYPVTPAGLTSTNYTISNTGGGTLTVTPAPLAVTANNASKVYGEPNPVFTASFSGFVLGQDPSVLGGTLTFITDVTESSNAGTYAVTPAGLTSANYTIAFTGGTFHVLKAPLTVTPEDKSRPYGTANPTFTATYSGFVLNQGPGDLTGALTFTTMATQTSPVGTYPITPAGLSSDNYAITYADGTLTITGITLTGKVVAQGRPDQSAAYVRLLKNGVVVAEGPPDSAGNFAFVGVVDGVYTLEVTRPGHLAWMLTIEVAGSQLVTPVGAIEVWLPFGDLDSDGDIDQDDLAAFMGTYGEMVQPGSVRDINGDGELNLFDLVLMARNIGQ